MDFKNVIAIDAMGGDNAPGEIIKGAIDAINERADIKLRLFGDRDKIEAELHKYTYNKEQIEITHTTEEISCNVAPAIAIKKKKDSSLVVAIKSVKNGECDAIVSALIIPVRLPFLLLPVRFLLQDAFEALIGAIYIDGGMDKARFFIHNHLLKDVEDKSLFYDAKTILQEMVQAGPDSRLQYVLTREAGPDHAKEFTVETRIGGKTYAIGKGKTKKGAERYTLLATVTSS